MSRKEIDYRCLILQKYYWLEEHQSECDNYFKSYMRLNRVMCKMDDECISRDISEYEDIFN